MTPKIQKISDEIVKTKEKISKSQARLRDLERQLTEAQNAEIIATVRAVDVAPEDLAAFIQSMKHGGHHLED